MLEADRPIKNSQEDCLNRTSFAKYLARCMLDHTDPESLVVGLYGDWGCGKTSILNLVVEELNYAANHLADADKPIILNFSPWSYSGQGQLIYNFFRRLSATLQRVDFLTNPEQIIYLLELYVSYFTQKPISKHLRIKSSWLSKFKKQTPDLYAWETGRDLTLIKAELNALLRAQNHKIIIIIDNISRLYPDEVKQIFQIVKSMGDYAQTVYLLAFDKTQVINAINRVDGAGGEEYIAKVVQLPFAVPAILEQELELILLNRLHSIIKCVPKEAWNKNYWADLYYNCLKTFFANVRDITRYINTLSFSYLRIRDVVNAMDFFALTVLEVFQPKIYAGIRDNKDLFTDLLDNVYVLDQSQLQQDKKRIDDVLARAEDEQVLLVLELLMRLFPRVRKIYQPDFIFYHSNQIARKLKRICSPDLFDIYFRLYIQTGQLSHAEFTTILNFASNPQAFDQALTRLNQDERILYFLDQLDSMVLQKIPTQYIPAIINALIDNGDLFPEGTGSLAALTTAQRLHRIIHYLLRRLPKSEERFACLQQAIANATKSIYICVFELLAQSQEHSEESDNFIPLEYRDLTPTELMSLKKLTAGRIQMWSGENRLMLLPQVMPLLKAWQEWGDAAACKEFIRQTIATPRYLTAFLAAALDPAIKQAMTKYEKDASWEQMLPDIHLLINKDELEPYARALFQSAEFEKLNEREQLSIIIYLDLVNSTAKKVMPDMSVS